VPERRFDGNVAIVTGAGQGIGRAIAERFGAEGAAVAVADRNPDTAAEVAASIESAGGQAVPLCVDVTNPADAERLAAEAVERLGRIDVLVNNAGILRSTRAAEVTPEE
jgi:NAD(P)-dependent dehydrogenase (short-subunit alcohol dehydrogenase family)